MDDLYLICKLNGSNEPFTTTSLLNVQECLGRRISDDVIAYRVFAIPSMEEVESVTCGVIFKSKLKVKMKGS